MMEQLGFLAVRDGRVPGGPRLGMLGTGIGFWYKDRAAQTLKN
jgi:hypothetical protein